MDPPKQDAGGAEEWAGWTQIRVQEKKIKTKGKEKPMENSPILQKKGTLTMAH
jgi:hypothetical protein